MSELKISEEFEERLKNRKNLKKPVIKVPKNRGKFQQGGEQFFWLARIYTPVCFSPGGAEAGPSCQTQRLQHLCRALGRGGETQPGRQTQPQIKIDQQGKDFFIFF